MAHTRTEVAEADARVAKVCLHRLRREPAGGREICRQIEMIERDERLDAMAQTRIDHTIIERQALGIHRAIPPHDTAPGKRERESADALGRAGGDVLLVVMVEIARVPARRRNRAPQPILPDRRLSPARRRGALHLVSGHRRPQHELLRYLAYHPFPLLLLPS